MSRGKLAGSTLELVSEQLDALEHRVDARVYGILRAGEVLAPEAAQQAWMEKFAVVQLRDKLLQISRSGKSAAARIKPLME